MGAKSGTAYRGHGPLLQILSAAARACKNCGSGFSRDSRAGKMNT